MPVDPLPEAEPFVAEVCWHYFVNEMTQAEIARHLGVTRLRVNQAIQRARSQGMVKIEIDSPFVPRLALQDGLMQRFGLKRACVAPADPDHYDYHGPVGAALAAFMAERLRTGAWHRLGVSWGMTLQSAIDRLVQESHPDLEIISMIGGTSRGESFNAFGIASTLAGRLGARYSLLAAPVFLAPQVDRSVFLSQDIFAEHYDKMGRLDAAIMTASDISQASYLIRTGLPAGISAQDLTRAGAVGDVVGRFLDASGQVVATRLNDSTIGIELEVLRQAPERVLAAAGPHKVAILRAVLQAGLATVLVTDDVTARLLLDQP
ncbi:sugar-binding transcriptional regulator [Paracoccus yeei]|uniref:Transcriptional regulator n=1 Tax=Paracoccus yeei TaxID=147645 RepID=A0A2D2C7L1_9RHOB|nr:sugar-binding domain-containing protein [Paracoccus yeei]ATQ58457.1 transcriptional regulator [Paracoccus yeei]OWJ90285.1 transcriptional regulator [Paracoccus yeei]